MSQLEGTILITGVPGWLGNRFLKILHDGFEEDGVQNVPHRIRKVRCIKLKNVELGRLGSVFSDVEFVDADLRDRDSLEKALRDVTTVFHVAGIIHPRATRELFEINHLGTENLLAASWENGVRRFVHISSNSVSGVTREARLMKESDPPRPYLAYGQSKYLAEMAVQRYVQGKKLEGVILRPCWYYGPGQPERQTRFFRMIKRGNPLIFGNGKNLRSMSYLDNVIQAMLLAATVDQANGQVYWVADERPYPVVEIYQVLAELLGVKDLRPRHIPSFVSEACLATDWCIQKLGRYQQEIHVAGEMNKYIACTIEKARSELGYRPRIELREGMRRSIEWCRSSGIQL